MATTDQTLTGADRHAPAATAGTKAPGAESLAPQQVRIMGRAS